jgi:KaiC/GvpD/RAD55 family RecA-like ATPase
MPDVLRFGIRSLDELLGCASRGHFGIRLEEDRKKPEKTKSRAKVLTTSVCIIGPNGAGKSIFGLHMASRYLADCLAEHQKALAAAIAKDQKQTAKRWHSRLPSVLYVSTDLTNDMAQKAWKNFALNYPFSRQDPFHSDLNLRGSEKEKEMLLEPCKPTMLEKDFALLEREKGRVFFVDIASYTAGDDWGFLHKLLSLLPTPSRDRDPRHLVVVDAIEGFEALAGDLNAFGEKSTRRSRIAQVMRLAARKCHVLLVVEESKEHEKYEELAEQFVADTVIRLENFSARNYDRRVLKIEKVRGQSHIRGQHHYSIRSGSGSTTGGQANPDDPEVLAYPVALSERNDETPKQSYVHVYHSVHRLNRKIMEEKGRARRKLKPNTYYAAFGIKYLDNMLGGKDEITRQISGTGKYTGYYHDTRGLPCGHTTTLIGDSLTQKSTLGKAFLSRCFQSFDLRLTPVYDLLQKRDASATDEAWALILQRVAPLTDSDLSNYEKAGKQLIRAGNWEELSYYLHQHGRLPQVPLEKSLSRDEQLTHFAAWLLDYRAGLAVMLVTHNTHHEQLALEFIGWLHSKADLKKLNSTKPGYERALRN